MPPVLTSEPRARRTHARRSCDVCKLRKTRCELPDLDVPASGTPLPTDKSCHRCRVLMLPCIVDDSNMKKRRKKQDSTGSSVSAASNSITSASGITTTPRTARSGDHARRPSRTSTGETSPGTLSPGDGPGKRRQRTPSFSLSRRSSGAEDAGVVNPIDHSVDISAAFPLEFASATPKRLSASPELDSNKPSPSVRMHGRPLSLLGAMLNVASCKLYGGSPRRVMVIDDLDLEQCISPFMRNRLAGGFAQLRTFHPHLQRLPDLFSLNREYPGDISIQLLLASSAYVALQSLPHDNEARALRDDLAPSVSRLQSLVLAQQPTSFYAIQALEVLTLQAPFAPALPFQLSDPKTVAPARGLVGVARNISEQLGFNTMVNSRVERWGNPDYWLWLGLRIGEAQIALEDERPRKPVLLADSRLSSAAMVNPDSQPLWTSPLSMEDPAELLGKLTICDRLARLDELHDCLGRFHNALENSSNVVNFDGATAIVEELQYYSRRMAAIDQRHDDVLAMLSLPQSLVSGWLSYRTMRRRWESMKTLLSALQTLVALHYLPGSIYGVANLPNGLNTAQGIHYALNRSNDPNNILFAVATGSRAAEEIRRCSQLRGEQAERQLLSFIEISPSICPTHRGLADIAPLHDIIALTLESCKALMEIEASKIVMVRSTYNVPSPMTMPAWVPSLTQISHVFRKLSLIRYEDEDAGCGEDITNACSNLVGAMVRTVQEWMTAMEAESGGGGQVFAHQQPDHMQHLPMSTSQPPLSYRSASPFFPGNKMPRRASTTGGDMTMAVDTNLLSTMPPSNPQSYASSDGWVHEENNQPRSVSAPGMAMPFMSQYSPSPPHDLINNLELTPPPPPLPPLMTITPPSVASQMTSEANTYPVPPAPTTATATQTQHLDHLLSEMFGYSGYTAPSQQSAPPMPTPVFPPPSPVQVQPASASNISSDIQMSHQLLPPQQQQQQLQQGHIMPQ